MPLGIGVSITSSHSIQLCILPKFSALNVLFFTLIAMPNASTDDWGLFPLTTGAGLVFFQKFTINHLHPARSSAVLSRKAFSVAQKQYNVVPSLPTLYDFLENSNNIR